VSFKPCNASRGRWLAGAGLALHAVGIVAFALGAAGCSSARKKTPELSEMLGKPVALISVEGEQTARSVTEVALVNQLIKHGSFELVSKQDVEKARQAPDQDPTDWIGIARRAGAEYGLRAKVLEFDATERQGYSSEQKEDPRLEQDMGSLMKKGQKTERVYKVKSLTGKVRVQLEFAKTDPKDPDLRTAVAEAEDSVTVEAKTEAAHLPPRLRFLEKLENEAFAKFFEQYK
jgi:hypothetical protein